VSQTSLEVVFFLVSMHGNSKKKKKLPGNGR